MSPNLGAASTTELDSDEEHGGTLKQNCSVRSEQGAEQLSLHNDQDCEIQFSS